MSLKTNLQQLIKDRNGGIFTIDELADYCKKANYKLSNAERRLRPSDSPNIKRVMKKGYIIGYRYELQDQNQTSRPTNEPDRPPTGQDALPVQFPMFSGNAWKSSQPFPETAKGKREI